MKLSEAQEITELRFLNSDRKNAFKDIFPKSVELIEKLDDEKLYLNMEDYQGSDFAVGCYGTLKAWAYQVCEWAYMDDYEDDYESEEDKENLYQIFLCPLMNRFEPNGLIDIINEMWSIEIKEVNY